MKSLIIYVLNIFILGLFLYSKLLPHKSNIDNKYSGLFNFFDRIFTPILNFFKKYIKPFQIGRFLHIDLTDVVLVLLLLILLNSIK
jgi:hypothetical protein